MKRGSTRLLWAVAALAAACEPAFEGNATGIVLSERTGGPTVVFDLDARPLPDIPFPNDLLTRADPTRPTGRRLNLSLVGPTRLERRLRAQLNRLDGFGVYAPITVRFDAQIDVEGLRERHRNRIATDDAVYVINVDPQSPGFGERVPLDLGYWAELPEALRLSPAHRAPRTGRFPHALSRPDQYFPYDPRAGTASLTLEGADEVDVNGDGRLDDDEDTDGDGVFDRQNVARGTPAAGSTAQADALVPFYEYETHTLVVRPVVPLREATRYAVVLSRFVTDPQGRPVQSPFVFVNHTRQTQDLVPLLDALPRHGLNPEDVAFAWTFTTQSATRDLLAIRRGLYGQGPLGWLAEAFPAALTEVWPWHTAGSAAACAAAGGDAEACRPKHGAHVVDAFTLLDALRPLAGARLGAAAADALVDSYRFVDYFVGGRFIAPDFLVDRDDAAADGDPHDDARFEVDVDAGEAVVGETEVTFWCAVPKRLESVDRAGRRRVQAPPFPVVLYGHGHGGSRLELLGVAGHHARLGLATCALDAYGHGPVLTAEQRRLVERGLPPALARTGIDAGAVRRQLAQGRARDLNNDGVPDSGGDFWSADPFHTRDLVRQSAVEWLQFVRLLRGFDGERRSSLDLDGDGEPGDLAGDFDGDGVVDLGGLVTGPGGARRPNDTFAWGHGLGGILSGVVPPLEPSMVAAAPTAGAAGLADALSRSVQPAALHGAVLRLMGPLVLGDPVYEGEGEAARFTGRYRLHWLVPDASPPAGAPDAARVFIAEVALDDGDVVTVRNRTREADTLFGLPERRFAVVRAGEGFRVPFAADAWSAPEKRARLGFDPRAEGFAPVRLTEAQVLASGDRFAIEVFPAGAAAAPRAVVDAWAEDTTWQGTVYPAGAPLVAPAAGLGLRRGTPALRRYFHVAQAVLDGGDPVAYAPLFFERPVDQTDTDPHHPSETRALVIAPTGDQAVPVNTALALARALGIVDFEKPRRDLYGLTEDDLLLAVGAYEGTARYPRWIDERGPYHFDVDDLDEGTDGLATDPRGNFRLRLTKKTPQGGVAALRMPYGARADAEGDPHGFGLSRPERPFDLGTFMAHQVGFFFSRRGEGISRSELDLRCLQYRGDDARSCRFMPLYPAE